MNCRTATSNSLKHKILGLDSRDLESKSRDSRAYIYYKN